MKYRFFSLAAVALTLTLSCEVKEQIEGPDNPAGGETDKPEDLPSLNEGEIAFRANGEFFYDEDSDDTDGVMSCFEDGTTASVFTAGYEAPVEVQAVNTQTNAYFVAVAEASKTYYAVYPSSVPHRFDTGEHGVSMSVTIPQEQDGSLLSASISVASTTGKDACLDFRNICGLLKFSTTSQNIKSVTFSGASGEDLVGTVSVSGFDPETGEPVFGDITKPGKEAKLNVEGRKGVFYVALLPGLTLEKGFQATFEMMPQEKELEDAVSGYSMTVTRSSFMDLGNILEYIPQPSWFVTETGAGSHDGTSWENAISGEQMFQMLACNRPEESGEGNTTTDITTSANKDIYADYLKIHNTKHVLQLDGVTFRIAQGDYSTQNYVRVSFPELGRKVRITLCGGYDPRSTGKDLSARDIVRYPTVIKAPVGAGTARMFFFQRWLDMTLDGLTFTGGKGDSSVGGGAILLNETSTSSFLFKDCIFTRNSSLSHGGAVTASSDVGQISFVGCTFSANTAAKSGGAILIREGQFDFTDCVIDGNHSMGEGGAFYMTGAAEVSVAGGKFTSNVAGTNAGAAFVACNKFSATGVEFVGNKGELTEAGNSQGGAIYFANDTTGVERSISKCLFKENTVDAAKAVFNSEEGGIKNYVRGGAVYIQASSPNVVFSTCTFESNKQLNATGSYKKFGGGAIYATKTFTATGCIFKTNDAYQYGAIGIEGGSVSIHGGDFVSNSATNGGAVGATGGTTSLNGCEFSQNNSSDFGGALNFKNSSLTCTGCTFSENSSVNNGGAVWLNAMSKADFIDCDFTSNVSTANLAGAICLSGANPLNITGGTFQANKANEGGCIYNNAASSISITGTKFIDNIASTGVAGVFYCNTNSGPIINIDNAEFSGNTAAKEGGAILFRNGTWTVTNTAFENNTSVSNGGSIYAHTGTLTLTGGSFSGNKTTSGSVGGGAIYVTTDAELSVERTAFSENSAQKTGETGAGKGGAICIANSAAASHTIKNATFTANTDALAGGALFIDTKAVEIDGCTFDGNSAKGHGGAIHATGAATFTIKNSTFEKNVLNADLAGGAIYSNATSTGNLISSTKFISNTTKGNGGAIYWSGTGRLAIDKSYFEGNVATKQGAAIRKTTGILYLNATSFTGNKSAGGRTAGVIRLEKDSFFNNCCFYGNEADVTHTDLVLVGGTTTVLNSTLYESNSTMACIRVYNNGVVANLYNNVLLNPNTGSADGSVRVGYYANPGSITSPGYNYTTEWKTLLDDGVAGSVTMAGTDKVVAYNDVSGNFKSASTADGRGYYTWTKTSDVTGTTSANVTAFLNGITGGNDFAAWLATVDGLTKDIAGNARPDTGWYPGCYQGN